MDMPHTGNCLNLSLVRLSFFLVTVITLSLTVKAVKCSIGMTAELDQQLLTIPAVRTVIQLSGVSFKRDTGLFVPNDSVSNVAPLPELSILFFQTRDLGLQIQSLRT